MGTGASREEPRTGQQELDYFDFPKNSQLQKQSTSYSRPKLQSLAHLHRSSIPTKSFTYQELAKATDDFSDHNSLGWDGCCYVYRGKLSNTEVMIKDFDGCDDTGFLSEILVIGRTNHPNIVKMVGYCVGAGIRMLVLEIVPNNTLDFHLHDCRFQLCYTICMFPDYCSDNRHSDKSDVFSFGFILLELITGKKPFFSAVDQSPHVATWIMPPLKNALNKCDYTALVDPTLGNQYSKEEMGRMIHCAAACIYKLERNGPQMKEIVQVLEGDMSMKLIWQHEKDKHYIRTLLC
ncbi:proline-rich receptor-like protein kinase PERK1 isoform X3 [Euphorbia lathyris]|uniref:proline-rich receptor-like protein kinase PERK1 isoform X3 n=1 Tax=Euphorbia lathyris TaxID=212925 RepID=UPI0033134DC3